MLSSLSTHPALCLEFPSPYSFLCSPSLYLDISPLCETSRLPWANRGACHSASPIWPLARNDYVSISKKHGYSPCLQRAQEPKALKHRPRLISHEFNPQCPEDYCRLSCLVITKGARTEGHIPKPAPLCPWPSLNLSNSSISHCIVSTHDPNLVSSL